MNKKIQYAKLTTDLKNEIRTLYVQGFDDESGIRKTYTLEELALKFNIAKSTIYRNAKQEDWKIQKEQFQSKYLEDLDKIRLKELRKESITLDNNNDNNTTNQLTMY